MSSEEEQKLRRSPSVQSLGLLPAPLDGGWGWVILASSFFCAAVVEGLITLMGVILPDLLLYYGRSRAETTFAGSLMTGMFLLSGPLVSFVLNKFGCRITTMMGSIITTLGLILSTFAPNVKVFILFYGALAGLGLGFIYLPATVMVGFYFEKKRALATGIATSGAGAGLVIFSATAAVLLEHWGWRFTVMVIGMLALQVVILGALMRPLEENYPRFGHKSLPVGKKLDGEPPQLTEFLLKSEIKVEFSQSCSHIPSAKVNEKVKNDSPVSSSCHHLNTHKTHKDTLSPTPFMRDDIFYSASIADLPQYKEQPDRDHYIMSYSSLNVQRPNEDTVKERSFCYCPRIMDLSLLTNLPFVVILVAQCLVQFAMFIPVVFVVEFAQKFNVDAQLAASLISVVGVSNAFGRAFSGFIGNLKSVNCLYVTSGSQMVVGLSTFLAPIACYNYPSLVVYAIIYGIFIGVFVPLTTVLLVQYVGLHRLTNAYGLLSMFKGIASLLGPPIAGGILDRWSSFEVAFSLAGSMFVSAAMIFLLAPLAHRVQKRKRQQEANN